MLVDGVVGGAGTSGGFKGPASAKALAPGGAQSRQGRGLRWRSQRASSSKQAGGGGSGSGSGAHVQVAAAARQAVAEVAAVGRPRRRHRRLLALLPLLPLLPLRLRPPALLQPRGRQRAHRRACALLARPLLARLPQQQLPVLPLLPLRPASVRVHAAQPLQRALQQPLLGHQRPPAQLAQCRVVQVREAHLRGGGGGWGLGGWVGGLGWGGGWGGGGLGGLVERGWQPGGVMLWVG